ncbi:RNA polymerase sigma factor [Filimonas lacunae]|uniref:RNA polymerase sigma factor n=1 Tax=Filimonas lacunae TaxID=477680 RepID=UPI0007D712FC|nr:RNA polymerase sigma factor [Filimonas lacunae]BAV04057.1 RNA polymerase ECF-type sigma factor [Filimonas lacunae]
MFYADMYRHCRRYITDPHTILSVLNDAFMKVFKNIEAYKGDGSLFRAWMKKVLMNTIIDHLRVTKAQLYVVHMDEVRELGEDDFYMDSKWSREQLGIHLAALPPVTRLVTSLFAFEGYTHQEISLALDISEKTSRWHLFEGRKKLKQMLCLKSTK